MRHNSLMPKTAAQRAQDYRARRRAMELATRNHDACRVCGNPLPTDRRSDQELCSQRCRQRLTDARNGAERERLLNSDLHHWRWASLECRRLQRKGQQPTKEQERLARGWETWAMLRNQEPALEHGQLLEMATLRKAVATAAVEGKPTKRLQLQWEARLKQLQAEQAAEESTWERDEEWEAAEAAHKQKLQQAWEAHMQRRNALVGNDWDAVDAEDAAYEAEVRELKRERAEEDLRDA